MAASKHRQFLASPSMGPDYRPQLGKADGDPKSCKRRELLISRRMWWVLSSRWAKHVQMHHWELSAHFLAQDNDWSHWRRRELSTNCTIPTNCSQEWKKLTRETYKEREEEGSLTKEKSDRTCRRYSYNTVARSVGFHLKLKAIRRHEDSHCHFRVPQRQERVLRSKRVCDPRRSAKELRLTIV